MRLLAQAQDWARRVKRDAVAVYFAARDPRTPMLARCLALAIAAYALSPIDLIPDFIPVIGYLDELILLPLGIWLVVSLIPPEIMVEYRARADESGQRPTSRAGMAVIILLWIAGALTLGWIGYAWWSRP